ncbi:MAG: hypothetical protein CBE47_04450 [Pelagibacteraceae bacterium TMED287]|nr:MAG: hypothetical protein CBE47_04450 [Pelagibacteraceae bacterium TMED287]
MKYLVGDIGNTLTKFSLLNGSFQIIKSYNIETIKLYNKKNSQMFLKKFSLPEINKKVLFSSVVPSIYKIIKLNLKKKKIETIELKDLNISKIIKFNIKNLNQLGSDRISNAIGAYTNYKNNCLVVDFGTATTFDIVKKPGIYDGGVIAPGIKLSIINLKKSTALLPMLSLKNIAKPFGKNTKEALNSGFLWGYQGLINNIIKKITLSSKKKYKIILTGGYSNIFRRHISYKSIIDENITIKGIIKVYKDLLK